MNGKPNTPNDLRAKTTTDRELDDDPIMASWLKGRSEKGAPGEREKEGTDLLHRLSLRGGGDVDGESGEIIVLCVGIAERLGMRRVVDFVLLVVV